MMVPNIPQFTLNNGTSIPAIGIGCWMGFAGEGEDVTQMVKSALAVGYRHIDTASNYGNEESVGRALRESQVPRSEVYITTKLDGKDHGRVGYALHRSLEKLGVEYVDLFLMHWPQALSETNEALGPDESPTFAETWKEMESLVDAGKAKSIGVSNFSIKTLTALLAHARIVPAVNQVEAHPGLPQHALLAFCRTHGILVTAYSPVGKNKYATHPTIAQVAARRGATAAQVLLSWGVARGTAVVPKSQSEERLKQNISLVALTAEDMRALDTLHEEPRMHRSVCGFHSGELGGSCFGWTYEQLGWDMVEGGRVPERRKDGEEGSV